MIYLSYYLTYPEEGSEMNDAVKVGIAVGAVALVAIGLGKMSKARLRLKICVRHIRSVWIRYKNGSTPRVELACKNTMTSISDTIRP